MRSIERKRCRLHRALPPCSLAAPVAQSCRVPVDVVASSLCAFHETTEQSGEATSRHSCRSCLAVMKGRILKQKYIKLNKLVTRSFAA